MIEEYIKKSKATFYKNFRVKNLIKNIPPAKSALNNFCFLETSLFMNKYCFTTNINDHY